ncbi:MAG: glycosyltransferase family 4 protein [Patescibacteria group bacterium]
MKILSNDYPTNLPSNSNIAPGGPAHFARAFSGYAVGCGHEWLGLIHQGTQEEKTGIVKDSTVDAKNYYIFSYPYKHFQSFIDSKKKIDPRAWFTPQINCIRKFIRRAKPDILFLNGFSVYAWQLLEAARQENLPTVIQHAGIAQVEFEQYKHLYTHAVRMSVLQMERDIVDAASKQVFLNAFSHEAFCKRVAPVPERQTAIIPLPYQEVFAKKYLKSTKKKTTDKAAVIGCVARWDRIKNHDAILRLAIEAKRQKLDWKFKCVTKIPETRVQYRFKCSYKNAIEVVSPMPTSDLMDFYDSVDLLILPSHFDVSPTVVMEAALQRKATLISPNVGWISEYAACGQKEWIIDFTDAKRVVQRLRRLMKKPFPSRFRSIILNKHEPKKVFSAYLHLFKSVT